jgi:Domain of unknown function (DUF4440)
MLKAAALLLLLLSVAGCVRAQDPDDDPNLTAEQNRIRRAGVAEMRRQELVNLENEAAHAIQLNSVTFFRRVYSDEFIGTMSHGQPVDKNSFIEAVQNPEVKYASFVASDVSIRTYQQTAVVTCMWSFRATFRGKSISTQMRVLHVYVDGPRGWRVVAGQLTALPPATEQPL